MRWLRRFVGRDPSLPNADAQRLQRWHALAPPAADTPLREARFIILDTETSGLNPHKDRLLSIAAVAVEHGCVHLSDIFDCVLQQCAPSANENIVIHGISGSEQLDGEPPVSALLRFLEFAHKHPLVAFRADFDRRFIDAALQQHLGCASAGPWLDLADLMPALFPDEGATQLDDWLLRFGITPARRHSALGDAAACAELMLIALTQAHTRRIDNLRNLRKSIAQRRWLRQ